MVREDTNHGGGRPGNFELLGHGFVPTYKKGDKGKYQLVAKKSSWGSLKRKLKGITKKTRPTNLKNGSRSWQKYAGDGSTITGSPAYKSGLKPSMSG